MVKERHKLEEIGERGNHYDLMLEESKFRRIPPIKGCLFDIWIRPVVFKVNNNSYRAVFYIVNFASRSYRSYQLVLPLRWTYGVLSLILTDLTLNNWCSRWDGGKILSHGWTWFQIEKEQRSWDLHKHHEHITLWGTEWCGSLPNWTMSDLMDIFVSQTCEPLWCVKLIMSTPLELIHHRSLGFHIRDDINCTGSHFWPCSSVSNVENLQINKSDCRIRY